MIKQVIYSSCGRVFRYFPFLNHIRLRKTKLISTNAILTHTKIDCIGNNNKIIIGDGTRLRKCSIMIRGNNNEIHIGKNVKGTGLLIWIENDSNLIDISDDVIFTNNDRIACMEGQKVLIGKDCLFSSDIVLRTGDSHALLDEYGARINLSLPVVIGDHVWVGQRAIILKGVDVKRDSVIAAGAVITRREYESNVVIAGNPGSVVKRGINWNHDRHYGSKS